jgi:hypothetical protein
MGSIGRILLIFVVAGVTPALLPTTAAAQSTREPGAAMLVAGVIYQKAIFGDDSPKTAAAVGPAVGLLLRSGRSGRTAFTLEIIAQPNPPINPHYTESFAPFVVMGGAQIGRRTYVRLSGGVMTVTNIAPMIGLAAGIERPVGTRSVAVEGVARAGGSPGAFGGATGLQALFRF